jgi:hypothetical protein
MTTSLITIHVEVLVAIKRKEFVRYQPLIKNVANIWNLSKFNFLYHNNDHDTKKCYTLKNKIESLISKGYLKQFYKKRNVTRTNREISI